MPGRILELLARPQLTDLPENPVGKVLERLRSVYADYTEQELPEVVNLADAEGTIAREAMYVSRTSCIVWTKDASCGTT